AQRHPFESDHHTPSREALRVRVVPHDPAEGFDGDLRGGGFFGADRAGFVAEAMGPDALERGFDPGAWRRADAEASARAGVADTHSEVVRALQVPRPTRRKRRAWAIWRQEREKRGRRAPGSCRFTSPAPRCLWLVTIAARALHSGHEWQAKPPSQPRRHLGQLLSKREPRDRPQPALVQVTVRRADRQSFDLVVHPLRLSLQVISGCRHPFMVRARLSCTWVYREFQGWPRR